MNLPDQLVLIVLNLGLSPKETLDRLRSYDKIRQTVADRNKKIKKIEEESEKAIRLLEQDMLCPHDFRNTHGDPSGGSDSHEECLVCGQIIPRGDYRRS